MRNVYWKFKDSWGKVSYFLCEKKMSLTIYTTTYTNFSDLYFDKQGDEKINGIIISKNYKYYTIDGEILLELER